MSAQHHAKPTPVGGPLLNAVTLTAGVLILIMAAILAVRFFYGLGSVTNLNDGYPWGIWIVVDVMIGSAFACGGFSVAMLVYIFNKQEYHPLVRPALLASLFGYTLAGVAVIIDLGRWWNVWNMYWPWSANPNSVMFEVAICITLYIIVMWIEFAPTFFEKFSMNEAKRRLSKIMFLVIALGTLLPMMHQSSLGTLWVVLGQQVHPLWQTPLVPLLFLLTAIIMGYAVVLFESCVASSAYRRSIEMHLLTPLAKVMLGVVAAYLVARLADLLWRGVIGLAFAPSLEALMFWLETACFVAPFLLIGTESQRRNPARLFVAGIVIMLGGSLLRLNGFLIGYETVIGAETSGVNFRYFPSLTEILVTVGMFSLEVLGYVIITRRFPVLPREEAHA
ncbi:Ni/Fe-hydrogenase cytochrome b subunit [Sulfuricystis multivorans]|uniref:Ni/Fe-hydrogenase cytochrome b subunit n=1 Tax=Sulfuricystis multivorans TaxID=2211108 RepID=UPI000F8491B6|nr:Ni/Fe-hydrogenase cytochrome b subunit [Sulfuricystis multivorans]